VAIPYGVYDPARNQGWVSVGIAHDTAEFAVASIRHWWRQMGRHAYPQAKQLLITADSGGSNGSRVHLWKWRLQKLADETRLRISVCHFPPGTSKWNTIEHQMFCHIAENWRGRPLISRAVIVNLIGHTTTRDGLRVKAALDEANYKQRIKLTEEQIASIHIVKDSLHIPAIFRHRRTVYHAAGDNDQHDHLSKTNEPTEFHGYTLCFVDGGKENGRLTY
jgi:Rhodopirellula transposase DDE domain